MIGVYEMIKCWDFKKEMKVCFIMIVIVNTISLGLKIHDFTLGKYSTVGMSFKFIWYFVEIIIMIFLYNKVIKPLNEFTDEHNEKSTKNENISLNEKDK